MACLSSKPSACQSTCHIYELSSSRRTETQVNRRYLDEDKSQSFNYSIANKISCDPGDNRNVCSKQCICDIKVRKLNHPGK